MPNIPPFVPPRMGPPGMQLNLSMRQQLVMTPELSADTNEEARKSREAIRNRFKLMDTSTEDEKDQEK